MIINQIVIVEVVIKIVIIFSENRNFIDDFMVFFAVSFVSMVHKNAKYHDSKILRNRK